MKTIIILTLITLSTSCIENAKSSDPLIDLYDTVWVDSYEETRDKDVAYQIFRPVEFDDFAPSWFRMRYQFSEDGTCQWLYLAPNDGHYMKAGYWKIDDELLVSVSDDKNNLLIKFQILEIGKDILTIQQIK